MMGELRAISVTVMSTGVEWGPPECCDGYSGRLMTIKVIVLASKVS